MAYKVIIDDKEYVVDFVDGAIVVETDKCVEDIRKVINTMFYGVEVLRDGNKVYFVPKEKSGVRDEFKPLFANYFPKETVEQNPIYIPLLAVGAIVAVVGICQVWPDIPLCEAISGYTWNVVMPLIGFLLGAIVGYYVVKGV